MRIGTFVGTLGRDWEKKTVGQYTVFENSLAVRIDKEKTLWVKLAQWNEKAGQTLMQYTGKGCKLAVVGDVEVSAWKNKSDEAQAELRLRVNSFDLIEFKKEEEAVAEADFDSDAIPF